MSKTRQSTYRNDGFPCLERNVRMHDGEINDLGSTFPYLNLNSSVHTVPIISRYPMMPRATLSKVPRVLTYFTFPLLAPFA